MTVTVVLVKAEWRRLAWQPVTWDQADAAGKRFILLPEKKKEQERKKGKRSLGSFTVG